MSKEADERLAALRRAASRNAIQWRTHALSRCLERGIPLNAVRDAILLGEWIEDYPADYPLPSMLLLHSRSEPIHVVAAVDVQREIAYIITAYRPDLEHFEPDWKTRRITS